MIHSGYAPKNEAAGDDSLVYRDSKGAEIIIKSVTGGSAAYFYTNRGDKGKYTAETVYEDLYPQGKIDYVETRNGFIEFKMNLKELQKYLKEKFPQYKLTDKQY